MGGVGLHRILRDKGREKSGIFGVGGALECCFVP